MISRLFIQNYALIDNLEIDFNDGLNIITGETGAGKSILISAIGLVLGNRADLSAILNTEKKCVVEATIINFNAKKLKQILDEEFFDFTESELIIRREITPSGKSRAFVNDSPVKLTELKALMASLVSLHTQFETGNLTESEQQIEILDIYAENAEFLQKYVLHFQEFQSIDAKISKLKAEVANTQQQMEFYQFQLNELEQAKISVEEEMENQQQLQVMQNAEMIKASLEKVKMQLYESEIPVYSQISESIDDLENILDIVPNLKSDLNSLREALVLVEDVARNVGSIFEDIDFDGATFSYLVERSDLYNHLKKKYNCESAEELLAFQEELTEKVKKVDSLDENIGELLKQKEKHAENLLKLGLEIEKRRKNSALELNEEVSQILHNIGIKDGEFLIKIDRKIQENSEFIVENEKIAIFNNGLNQVTFTIRTNKGLNFGKLESVASGGELSRVMLAIKTALAKKAQLDVLIFDEIDTGVSGEIAMRVAKILSDRLSANHQVFVITHLPQTASRGKNHYHIYKVEENAKTISRIRKLSLDERIKELAKMISGEQITQTALETAKHLLEQQ